jgi:hypothetical protein
MKSEKRVLGNYNDLRELRNKLDLLEVDPLAFVFDGELTLVVNKDAVLRESMKVSNELCDAVVQTFL